MELVAALAGAVIGGALSLVATLWAQRREEARRRADRIRDAAADWLSWHLVLPRVGADVDDSPERRAHFDQGPLRSRLVHAGLHVEATAASVLSQLARSASREWNDADLWLLAQRITDSLRLRIDIQDGRRDKADQEDADQRLRSLYADYLQRLTRSLA